MSPDRNYGLFSSDLSAKYLNQKKRKKRSQVLLFLQPTLAAPAGQTKECMVLIFLDLKTCIIRNEFI